MRNIPGVRRGFRFPWRNRRDIDDDIDEELRFHLEMRTEELVNRFGLDPAAAQTEARRQFGDEIDARRYMRSLDRRTEAASHMRERTRGLLQDIAQSWRKLLRSPGFSATVVSCLALGIGSTTAIFTLINETQLRPLPVPEPEELVAFGDPTRVGVNETGPPRTNIFSYPLYIALRDGSRLLPDLLASGYSARLEVRVPGPPDVPSAAGPDILANVEPERPRGRLVSGNYFDVLRVRAALGRTLLPRDDDPAEASPVAVISHAYWKRRFASDPSIIGRTITVNRAAITIVGVAEGGFDGEIVGHRTDIWLPLTTQPLLLPNQHWLGDRNTSWLLLMGRLPPGIEAAQAGAELTTLARRELVEVTGALSADDAARVSVPFSAADHGFLGVPVGAATVLTILLVLTGLILVVVSANVANLMLARATARRTEIGVRIALGAGRLRVIRLLLMESLILGGLGGLLAILVVRGGFWLLVRSVERSGAAFPLGLPLDVRVVAFAGVLSLVTALILGLLPAVTTTRGNLAATLRTHGGGGGTGASRPRLWRLSLSHLLVVAQVAVSLVLLAGAGLLVRSLADLQESDMGLARDELLIVKVDANAAGYEGERLHALHRQLVERFRSIPGVRDVSYSQNGLFSGIESGASVELGEGPVSPEAEGTAAFDRVGPGYFQAIGARILVGRGFDERDAAGSPAVAVINQTMARIHFGNENPIGRELRVDDARYEIVGVVADVTGQSMRAKPQRRFYVALAQGAPVGGVVFEIRTNGDPASITRTIRTEVATANGLLRVGSAEPLTSLMRESLGLERMAAGLAGVAGALALMLAALGLYGVMTYTIVRRTRELGIRMALGARPNDLTRMVIRETLTLVLFGSLLGIPFAVAAAALLRSQLEGISLIDVPSLALALAILAATAALAGYSPALRAARVEPRIALASD